MENKKELFNKVSNTINKFKEEKVLTYYDTMTNIDFHRLLMNGNSDQLKKAYNSLTNEDRKIRIKNTLEADWGETLEENFDVLDRWDDDKKKYESDKQELIEFINKLNQNAITPIESNNYDYLSQIMAKYQNHKLWSFISTDKSAIKHFETDTYSRLDPSEIIIPIRVEYLLSHTYNPYSDDKMKGVQDLLDKNIQFEDLPYIVMTDGLVGEGNHRVKVLADAGYKAVPIKIFWK